MLVNFPSVGVQNDRKLREVSQEAGLMPLVQAFSEVLQDVYEDSTDDEMGEGGFFKEFVPFMVADVLGADPKLGVGDSIYKELKEKKV